MNGLDAIAMHRLTTMPERQRRANDETAGRGYAGIARALRRLRLPAVRATHAAPYGASGRTRIEY